MGIKIIKQNKAKWLIQAFFFKTKPMLALGVLFKCTFTSLAHPLDGPLDWRVKGAHTHEKHAGHDSPFWLFYG